MHIKQQESNHVMVIQNSSSSWDTCILAGVCIFFLLYGNSKKTKKETDCKPNFLLTLLFSTWTYIGCNVWYHIDPSCRSSVSGLVPRSGWWRRPGTASLLPTGRRRTWRTPSSGSVSTGLIYHYIPHVENPHFWLVENGSLELDY